MSYEETRQRHLADWAAIMPEHVQRLGWPASQLRAEREQKLRALLRIAIERSPWHRRRLAGLDPDTATEASLGRIPPMTTGDLMAHWDEIVTDPRLRLDLVEKYLAGLTGDAYLLGEFHAVASGGSSGQRGVFVYGWDAWATAHAGFLRPLVRETMTAPDMAGAPGRAAVIAAQHPAHMSAALAETFAGSAAEVRSFPVTLPVTQIVAGLNQWQPAMLLGYPTGLALLAAEARAGRLRISPRRAIASSEPLLPETRQALEQAFGAPVANMYGTSEAGPMAVGAPADPAGLESALASELRRHGLADPAVTVRTVREPDRLASGKTRRFVPLAPEV